MRPCKTRTIDVMPRCQRFIPEGERFHEEIVLALDMFEAFRLVDGEGLSQDEAAERMEVSKPTICRLVGEARQRVARALVLGCSLRIEGGSIVVRGGGHHGNCGGHHGCCAGRGYLK